MGDNNVASIGKMLMQTQSGQSVTGVDGADIGTTFRKMVDQMTQIPGSSVSTGSQTAQNMQQLTPHSPEQNYDRYQYQKNKIPEQSTKDWAAGSQVSEKLESFEESVRDVIKDELQVTDEQITEAMETLGLTVADLMNPQQLAALAAELTGTEDMSALLCNEAFMNVMQSVGTLTEDLLQQLGVTAEELTQLLEDAGQTDMDADLMQTVRTADAGETDVADAQKVYADTADGIVIRQNSRRWLPRQQRQRPEQKKQKTSLRKRLIRRQRQQMQAQRKRQLPMQLQGRIRNRHRPDQIPIPDSRILRRRHMRAWMYIPARR
mgnify:CR=1 FL=1